MSYRRWILVAVGLFATGMTFGLAMPDDTVNLFAEDLAVIEELAKLLVPFKFSTAAFIFLKNTSALLFSFIFSPLLCLVPVLALTVNSRLAFSGIAAPRYIRASGADYRRGRRTKLRHDDNYRPHFQEAKKSANPQPEAEYKIYGAGLYPAAAGGHN